MIDRSCKGQQCTGWQVSNTCHATLFLFFFFVFQARLVISDLLLLQRQYSLSVRVSKGFCQSYLQNLPYTHLLLLL